MLTSLQGSDHNLSKCSISYRSSASQSDCIIRIRNKFIQKCSVGVCIKRESFFNISFGSCRSFPVGEFVARDDPMTFR